MWLKYRILIGRKVNKKTRIMSYDYVVEVLGLREGVKCSYLIQQRIKKDNKKTLQGREMI